MVAGAVSIEFFRPPRSHVAGFVAPDQGAFVSVFVRPSYGQLRSLGDLLDDTGAERILDADDPLGVLLDPFLRQAGLDYARDVDPWLGREVGVAVGEGLDGRSDLTFVLEAEEPAVADDHLRPTAGAVADEYRGIEYHRPSGGDPDAREGWTVGRASEHVIVASSPEAFQGAVDAHLGRSLEDEDSYQDAARAAPADRLGLIFVRDPESVELGASLPPPLHFIAGTLFGGGEESFGIGLWAEPEALVVESSNRQPIRITAQMLDQILQSDR